MNAPLDRSIVRMCPHRNAPAALLWPVCLHVLRHLRKRESASLSRNTPVVRTRMCGRALCQVSGVYLCQAEAVGRLTLHFGPTHA